MKKPLQGNLGEVRMTGSNLLRVNDGRHRIHAVRTKRLRKRLGLRGGDSSLSARAGGISLVPGQDGWGQMMGWSDLFTGDVEKSKRLRAWKGSILSATPDIAGFHLDKPHPTPSGNLETGMAISNRLIVLSNSARGLARLI